MSELDHDWAVSCTADSGLGETSPTPNPSPKGEGRGAANPARGEAEIRVGGVTVILRPSFAALVAAEQELGSLFALVERAAAGRLSLHELVALFWHCVKDVPAALSREQLGEAVVSAGLAKVTPVLKVLLGQILGGR